MDVVAETITPARLVLRATGKYLDQSPIEYASAPGAEPVILKAPRPDQRFLAQEVVQTSAMDCGPAALKSILEGFGISASYGRLREACQTDVDGTSIDTLEDIAIQLGLQAEQVMLPADHLALPEAEALPAIVVVRLPNGLTHFLVVWGRVGDFLQVMDPATGRRWPTWKEFQNELYIHTFPVPLRPGGNGLGRKGCSSPCGAGCSTYRCRLRLPKD